MNILNKYIGQFTNTVTEKVDKLVEPLFNVDGPTSTNSFRQKLSGGVALTNQFIVGFNFPSFLKQASLSTLFGVSNFDNDVGIYCYQISNPSKKMKTESVNIYNNLNRLIPTGYSWDSLRLSFIETSNRKIYHLFDEWITGINNPLTNCGIHYSDSYGQIKCNLLDRKGNQAGYIVYEEAIPVAVSFNDLTWNSTNEMVSVTVEFSYIYPMTKDYTISNLYNAGYNFADSDIMNFAEDIYKGAKQNIMSTITSTGKDALSSITKWF